MMMTPTSKQQTELNYAKNLIPAYLKKTLLPNDQAWMEQFLKNLQANDPEASLAFAQEMAWVEQTQAQLIKSSPQMNVEAGWRKLQSRVEKESEMHSTTVKPALAQNLRGFIENAVRGKLELFQRFWSKPAVGILASSFIVVQMGLLALNYKHLNRIENAVNTEVSPASGSKSIDGMIIMQVSFKNTTSLLDMQILINQVHGQVVGGPGALGIWSIAVAKENSDDAMKQLSASKWVDSVTQQ